MLHIEQKKNVSNIDLISHYVNTYTFQIREFFNNVCLLKVVHAEFDWNCLKQKLLNVKWNFSLFGFTPWGMKQRIRFISVNNGGRYLSYLLRLPTVVVFSYKTTTYYRNFHQITEILRIANMCCEKPKH